MKILQNLFLFLIISTALLSCKKEITSTSGNQAITDKFFKLPSDANPVLIRIAEKLKKQNETKPFVENFVKSEGFPLWEHAQIKIASKKRDTRHLHANDNTSTSDTLVFIPLAIEQEEFIKGFISCIVQTDILFKLFEGEKYAEYGFDKNENRTIPNADDVAGKIIEFDKNIYGYNYVQITDNRLFENWEPNFEKPNQFLLDVSRFTTEISFVCGYTPIGGPCNGDPACGWGYEEDWCTVIFDWEYTDYGAGAGAGGGYTPVLDGGTINPSPYGGGGTGGIPPKPGEVNPGWQIPLCSVMRMSNTTLNFKTKCDQVNIYNQTYFAIKEFDVSEVTDPCLLDIIKNEIGEEGCSSYLLKLFQSSPDPTHANQLKFKFFVNDILTDVDGVTPVMSKTVFTQETNTTTGIVTTTASIKFNRQLLENASKEFLATLILHEITHGFLHIENPSANQMAHHKDIFEKHLGKIVESIGELYPSLVVNDAVDATAMALQGLDDYLFVPNTTTYDQTKDEKCLNDYGMSLTHARNIALEYLNGTKGTKCE